MTLAKLAEYIVAGTDFGADAVLRTEALAALVRVGGLQHELEDTELWLRGRASVIRQYAARHRGDPGLTVEAARFEGRAALVRQALVKFKE